MTKLSTSLLFVSILKNVFKDNVVSSFIKFIETMDHVFDFEYVIKLYSDFITEFYNQYPDGDLYAYIKNKVYTDENIISKGCSDCIKDNETIIKAAEFELSLLDKILAFDYKTIKELLQKKYKENMELTEYLPVFYTNNIENFDVHDLLKSYETKGYGIFACYSAFKVTGENNIRPVKHFDAMTFSELKNYEYQKEVIKKNTKAFLEGKEANNILLYGDRGCGKSSTVKALINEFKEYDLKIIQIYKESIIYLDDLFEKVRTLPCKFIIFADDISFEENDKNFSTIKASLEGSLSNRPKNVLIYATTNRMHLVKESFSSREGNEVHINDTIDETVSLSDRFGIILTFSLLTKTEYLEIASQIAIDCGIEPNDDFKRKAEAFATLKSIRTPRVARQFINDYIADTGC